MEVNVYDETIRKKLFPNYSVAEKIEGGGDKPFAVANKFKTKKFRAIPDKPQGENRWKTQRSKNYGDASEFVYAEFLPIYERGHPEEIKKPRITIEDIAASMPYKEVKQKTQLQRDLDKRHFGQRKLLLTEIEFLSKCLAFRTEKVTVIYAGSAPSMKQLIISNMFPNVKFVMIDPNESCIYQDNFRESHYTAKNNKYVYMSVGTDNRYPQKTPKWVKHYDGSDALVSMDRKLVRKYIPYADDCIDYINTSNHTFYFFEEYMTKQLAELFTGIDGKVFFWSDIRSNSVGDGECPPDVDVIANMAMYHTWVTALTKDKTEEDSFACMFKFRVPFLDDAVIKWDVFKDQFAESEIDWKKAVKERQFQLFDGEIYIQAWQGRTSTECRLWSTLADVKSPLKSYSITEHEDKMFYYNVIERFAMRFENPFANPLIGFDNCNDCAIEAYIYKDYIDKHDEEFDVNSMVRMVSRITGRDLFAGNHGFNA